MNLKEQTYICTLARCGTISRAAEELHFTQSGVSHTIATLESELGVPLFVRNRSGVTLTADGRALLASSSVGIELEGLRPSCRMAAVAAGARKAQAIASVMRSRPRALLVTDEGAAREMLRLASST